MSSITGKSPKKITYASELIQADAKDQPALGPTSQNESRSERWKWHWTASPRRTGDLPMSSSSFLTKFWKTAPTWLSQLARPGFWGSLRQKTLSGQIYFDSQMDFGFGLWSILKFFNWLPISKIQEDTVHSNSGYPPCLKNQKNWSCWVCIPHQPELRSKCPPAMGCGNSQLPCDRHPGSHHLRVQKASDLALPYEKRSGQKQSSHRWFSWRQGADLSLSKTQYSKPTWLLFDITNM